MQIKNTGRDAMMDALVDWLGLGCKLEIYTAAYGALLVEWSWGAGVKMYGNSASGVITLNTPAAETVAGVGTGNAAIAQIKSSGGTVMMKDFTVGVSSADFILDNVSIEVGQNVTLLHASSTMTAPNPGF